MKTQGRDFFVKTILLPALSGLLSRFVDAGDYEYLMFFIYWGIGWFIYTLLSAEDNKSEIEGNRSNYDLSDQNSKQDYKSKIELINRNLNIHCPRCSSIFLKRDAESVGDNLIRCPSCNQLTISND